MKVDLSARPDSLGVALVWQTPSRSEPGKFHLTVILVRESPDGLGLYRCTCPGFQFTKDCRHIQFAKEELLG